MPPHALDARIKMQRGVGSTYSHRMCMCARVRSSAPTPHLLIPTAHGHALLDLPVFELLRCVFSEKASCHVLNTLQQLSIHAMVFHVEKSDVFARHAHRRRRLLLLLLPPAAVTAARLLEERTNIDNGNAWASAGSGN